MKIFISWSGDRSKSIAEVLRDWLPSVLQSVKPFFTPNDIEKGARWASDIALELKTSDVGIFVITPENSEKPWIMFEAGAISRQIDSSRICVVLFGLESTDLKGPLTQFQATRFDKNDFKRLVENINDALGEARLKQTVLDSVFDMWWPDLEKKIKLIQEAHKLVPKSDGLRDQKDIIEEILSLSRAVYREIRTPEPPRSSGPAVAFRYAGSNYEKFVEAIKAFCLNVPFRNEQIAIIQPILNDLRNSIAESRLHEALKKAISRELTDLHSVLETEKISNTGDEEIDVPF